MILSSASTGCSGAWLVALVARGRPMLLAALPGRADAPLGCRRRWSSAWVLHAVLLVLDIGGLGRDSAGARLGFAPVLSLTVWLVLAVHTVESRLVPLPGVRRVLALVGAAAVVLAWAFPGETRCRPARPGRRCTGCWVSAPMVCSARRCCMR